MENRVEITLMQQSAIDLNLVLDASGSDFEKLFRELTSHYIIHYNTGLTPITIRHYTKETLDRILKGKEIYLEQHSILTAMVLVK